VQFWSFGLKGQLLLIAAVRAGGRPKGRAQPNRAGAPTKGAAQFVWPIAGRRILSRRPMRMRLLLAILPADRANKPGSNKEVNPKLLNPLAIGVTLGGQLLDIAVPRPKLRAGNSPEFSLLSQRTGTRTGFVASQDQEFVGLPVVSGRRA